MKTAITLTTPQSERAQIISAWDMSDVKALYIKQGGNPAKADEVVEQYKRFMLLYVLEPDKGFPMSEPVDAMWHAHILCTRDYADFCAQGVGYFVHHFPALTEKAKDALAEKYVANTLHGLWQTFGHVNQNYWPENAQVCFPPEEE